VSDAVLTGCCLCGAVTVTAVVPAEPGLTVCHCDMCRRHTSGMFIGLAPEQDSLVVEGPAKSFRSSDWAERGFCGTCGSTLWYGTVHDGARYLAAGLFEDAGGGRPAIEYFTDRCPGGYRLEHGGKRLTEAETVAFFEGSGEAGA
jgi:hypothetical protein